MEDYNTGPSVDVPQVNFVSEGIRMGLILGAIALLILFGSYFMGMDTFVTVQFIGTFVPYMIVILIVYGLKLRKRNGNYLSFKDGLQFTFLSYAIAAVMVAIGTYILFNLIDKDLTQKSFDLAIEKTRHMMERMNANPKDIEKELDSMDRQDTNIRTIFRGMGYGLIWDFVKSVLITLIIRREKPVV